MAKQSFQLDPNAATYTDNEIVGKVNAAAVKVDADQVEDGVTNKIYTGTEQTKLAGVAEGAEVNPADLAALDATANTKLAGIEEGADVNPTGGEMQTAILALDDATRKLIKTDPQAGEFTVLAVQRDLSGKLDVDYDDVAN